MQRMKKTSAVDYSKVDSVSASFDVDWQPSNSVTASPPKGIFPTLKGYDRSKQLIPDIVAGLTVGSLAVPQSMSYAMIAGLPVQNGLYSDLQIVYPVLGSSRHLVVGPVAIMSLITMGTLKETGLTPGSHEWIVLCSLLSFLVGIYQIVFASSGLGERISTAISERTVKSFTVCAALTIASTQISALLGVSPKACFPMMECDFSTVLSIGLIHDPNILTLMVSFSSLLILEVVRISFHKSLIAKMGSLIVMLLGIVFSLTVDAPQVKTVGSIPRGLPTSSPVFAFFSVDPAHLTRLALFACPMSLLGFAEAFAIAKTKSSDVLDPNRELAALGMANVWTAFCGGYACTGSFSRSAVNAEAGSTSGISCFVAALLVVLVLEVLTTPLSLLPKACVAAVVVAAIIRLCDTDYPTHLVHTNRRYDLACYLVVLISGLVAGVEVGLLIGFALDTLERLINSRLRSPASPEGRRRNPSHYDIEEEKNSS